MRKICTYIHVMYVELCNMRKVESITFCRSIIGLDFQSSVWFSVLKLGQHFQQCLVKPFSRPIAIGIIGRCSQFLIFVKCFIEPTRYCKWNCMIDVAPVITRTRTFEKLGDFVRPVTYKCTRYYKGMHINVISTSQLR